jgi:DNA-binding transcriptional ArsR family regulator
MHPQPNDLVRLFKALGDATRLRLVGTLARGPRTVEQLAAAAGVGSSTVSHHLKRLASVGLVHARAEGPYSVYALDRAPLQDLALRLAGDATLPDFAADSDLDAFDRKVLATFVDADGRIKAFPTQSKKSLVLVRYALEAVEPGVTYSEAQMNELLRRFSDDTARLRRAFVDHGFMQRTPDGAAYWRV